MKASVLAGLVLLIAPVLQSQEASKEFPPEVNELIAKLPECSRLRDQLKQGRFQENFDQSYVRAMVDHGVQRAYFEIKGNWRHNRAENLRIVRRLYYRQLDGPEGAIRDSATLKEIADSGLAAKLDQAVFERGKKARFSAGVDRWAGIGIIGALAWILKGSKIYGTMELFATPWVQDLNMVGPDLLRHDLAHSAYVGDVADISKRLGKEKHSQAELNRALVFAVGARRDNTAAIDLLIKAGADVNTRISDETTPLMLAVNTPCNIPVLLAHGARATDHDKWGRAASDLAGQRHGLLAARRLLENAKPVQ
jgi:hypothetical protein